MYSALQGWSLKPWGREWLNLTTHSKLLQSSNKRVTGAECFTTHLTLGFEKFSQVAFPKSSTELTNLFSSHQYTTITSNTVQNLWKQHFEGKKKEQKKNEVGYFPFFERKGHYIKKTRDGRSRYYSCLDLPSFRILIFDVFKQLLGKYCSPHKKRGKWDTFRTK